MKKILGPYNERLAQLAMTDLEKSLRGEKSSYTRVVLPIPVAPKEVKAARKAIASTQKQFAQVVGVSLETVKAWESGTRKPEGAASKLVRALIKRPKFAEFLASV